MQTVRTKIVATIGPATLDPQIFQKLVDEGIDFVRINTSYGDYNQYDVILKNLHDAKKTKDIKVLFDIKKEELIEYFVRNNLDWIALSFANDAIHIEDVRKKSNDAFIISKIESCEGVANFDEVLTHSDGIMIARGDLGKSMTLEKLPPLQKEFTLKTLAAKKFCITATEMLLSMTNKPTPTRAEVSDVANAVFEGTDAVMLSEETAMGKYPVECVRYMRKIVEEAERWHYRLK